MASLYHHQCSACGYSADVSGGRDCGMTAHTITLECLDCKKLVDAANGTIDMILLAPESIPAPRCPRNADHRVRPWGSGGPARSVATWWSGLIW